MNLKWFSLLLMITIISGCRNDVDMQYDLIQLDPETEYQLINGFGTSMVNYKEFPPEYFDDDFLDMVVYDLGLSILRIPITEHLEFMNDDNDPDHFNWDGFYMSNNNRRKGMVETMDIVKEFKNRGVNLFMASPWSPPQFMKTNRAPIQGGFLRADMYDEFAEYLAAYIILAKKNWDIDINWISLQNESIFIEFYRSCLYHGYGMKEALRAVMEKFNKEQINSRILINEDVLYPDRVHAFLQPVFSDPVTSKYNGDIAVHRHADADELIRWVELTREFNRNYLMTETSGHDTTWDGAMSLASDIHDYLAAGNFSAWIYWQISGNTGGSNPGLYTLMLEGKPTKKYYTSKHFYRFIRPGAIRIGASSINDSLLISAYKHPEEGTLTAVIINPSNASIHVKLEGHPLLPGRFNVYRSTETDLFSKEGKYRPGNLLHIPARSIVSLKGQNKNLNDPEKVTTLQEAWIDRDSGDTMLGNYTGFPFKSEWQGDCDTHAGRLLQAEMAYNSGEISKQRYDGWSLLHEAILNGDGDAVSYLIKKEANINIPANDGWTPLHAAASGFVGNRDIQIKNKEYNHYEIFRMILDAGADIEATTTDGWTPLHCAVANANTSYRQSESTAINRIRDLVNAGADIEARDKNGCTPLHWAAMQGYSHFINGRTVVESNIVSLLINSGAYVNAVDSFGRTPLHYAVQMGYEPISLELVKGRANILLEDSEKNTPVDIAKENKSSSILFILEHKKLPEANEASISLKNVKSSIPYPEKELIAAAISGDEEYVKHLLRNGVNIFYRDSDGFSAIDRARDNGYDMIVKLLSEAAASEKSKS